MLRTFANFGRRSFPALATGLSLLVASAAPAEVREVGELVLDGIPDVPERIVEKTRQYQNVRPATLADWTPDGKGLLILTRFGEAAQVHRVMQPLGARQQLTNFARILRDGLRFVA